MDTSSSSGILARFSTVIIAVGSVGGCGQMDTQPETAESPAGGTAQAMQNMQRIMMMPESQRMQYVSQAQSESLDRGRALFQSSDLGTNGQSCASCHPGGRTTGAQIEMMPGMRMPIPDLHGVSRTFPKFKVPNDAVITLSEMNNNCIVMFQAGTPLVLGSQESRDLAAFVDSLRD